MKNMTAAEMVPLARAPAIFGLSRSGLYRLHAAGKIRLVKLSTRRVLVDCASVRAFLATLPELKAAELEDPVEK